MLSSFTLAQRISKNVTEKPNSDIKSVSANKEGSNDAGKSKPNAPRTPQTPGKVAGAVEKINPDCTTSNPRNQSLAGSSNPLIKKLAEYEAVCNASFTRHLMLFTMMPGGNHDLQKWAVDITIILRQFSAHGVRPLVVLEPPRGMDLGAYSQGTYDQVMKDYFAAIKGGGISDAQMGDWVLFPEANIPEWGNTDPSVYASNVTRTAQMLKAVFPTAKVTIMLDSKTYPSDDKAYHHGKLTSLIPYVSGLPKGLIDSFGFQGFPWVPPANATGPSAADPAAFLDYRLAEEAARTLGVNEIWLNSGSFARYYANSPSRQVVASPETRQSILNGSVRQAQLLKNKGFQVWFNLFAEDKSAVSEAVDWSYWSPGAATSSPSTQVFKSFQSQLAANGIPLGIFDTLH